MAAACNPKAVNIWTARTIPVVLVGLAGYATYVVVVRVCVNHLLDPKTKISKRPQAAIAILIVYCILLLLLAFTYFRLLLTILTNPGFVPRGPQWHAEHVIKTKESRSVTQIRDEKPSEKRNGTLKSNGPYSCPSAPYGSASDDPAVPGLQDYYSKDMFSCGSDGRPDWCSHCLNWKPERAHHCSEVGRCVRKMDHFCPWVGGCVGEATFKFFVLFIFYGAIYCIFTLVVMSIFVTEQRNKSLDPHWIVVLALAALFSAFLLGMGISSLQFVLLNTTTIENLTRKVKVWQLAIHIPNPSTGGPTLPYHTVTYPIGQHSNREANGQQPSPLPILKTFAILHTKPGESIWNLGPWNNFKSVMGNHWHEWLIPLKHSPCSKHDRGDCSFATGPVVDRMKREAGLLPPSQEAAPGSSKRSTQQQHGTRKRKRRRNRHDAQSEEDPRLEAEGEGGEIIEEEKKRRRRSSRRRRTRRQQHHTHTRSRENDRIDDQAAVAPSTVSAA